MFSTPLIIEADMAAPDFWFVRGPLAWCDPVYGRLVVPAGLRTDMASIPRVLRNLPAFDPNGRSRRAAVAHDWLYAWQAWPKERCDLFLRSAMISDGCPIAEADAFYDAVKWFGHTSWTEDGKRGIFNAFDSVASYQAWTALQP